MEAAYFGLLEECGAREDVRAIVVTGEGRGFCAGADMQDLKDLGDGGLEARPATGERRPQTFPLSVPKPIIAAINGACFGIGLQQALCCDLRFAGDDAKFATAYARRGLVAEFGMSWLLPRLVGTGHAMDLMLSARLVRAPEALAMGLVNRVVPADELIAEATAYARQLAGQCSPWSMQAVKRQAYRDLMSNLFSSYERSEELLTEAMAQPDFKEGVTSWRENRAPAFAPLPEELAFIDLEG
jgi:enoyl-CoA hydratase/carnithine racemase